MHIITIFDVGLVSKVVKADELVDESVKLASKIASQSKIITQACKEAVKGITLFEKLYPILLWSYYIALPRCLELFRLSFPLLWTY